MFFHDRLFKIRCLIGGVALLEGFYGIIITMKVQLHKIKNETEKVLRMLKDNKKYVERQSKIYIEDILYFMIRHFGTKDKSYSKMTNELIIKKGEKIAQSSIHKKASKIGIGILSVINTALQNFIYDENSNKVRTIAVDGSQVYVPYSCAGDGAKSGSNDKYASVLLSSLYDIDTKIPINYSIYNNHNERTSLQDQIKYLKSGDILVADRGYYSKEIVNALREKGIDFILRIKKNAFKNLQLVKNDEIMRLNSRTVRILKYDIGSEEYIILTSLFNEPMEYFKETYWKRWNIETNFRELKYINTLNDFNVKKRSHLEMKILTHQLIMTYVGYILNVNIKSKRPGNSKFEINFNKSACIDIFLNNIVEIFFKPKFTGHSRQDLNFIGDLIENTVVYTIKNRKFERIRKSPVSKWCFLGHTFGQKKNKNKRPNKEKSKEKKNIGMEKYVVNLIPEKNIDRAPVVITNSTKINFGEKG